MAEELEILKKNEEVIVFRDKKFAFSHAGVNELRTGIFAPFLKVSGNSSIYNEFKKNGFKREIITSWGKATIKNKILTQIHRDIIDTLFIKNIKIEQIIDTQGEYTFYIYFKRSDILKHLDKKKENTNWLDKMLEDIKNALITIENEKFVSSFNIINEINYSKDYDSFRIELSKSYSKYFIQDLTINYKNEKLFAKKTFLWL